MLLEIERKFLVDTNRWTPPANGGILIKQAYLSTAPHPVVRVRVAGNKAFLTIKSSRTTLSRQEFEYEIPEAEALALLEMAISLTIEKTRYKIDIEGSVWEVDVFSGKNEGLVLAEIELESEDETFARPIWLSEEVTGDKRYYNSYLSTFPFVEWSGVMA